MLEPAIDAYRILSHCHLGRGGLRLFRLAAPPAPMMMAQARFNLVLPRPFILVVSSQSLAAFRNDWRQTAIRLPIYLGIGLSIYLASLLFYLSPLLVSFVTVVIWMSLNLPICLSKESILYA